MLDPKTLVLILWISRIALLVASGYTTSALFIQKTRWKWLALAGTIIYGVYSFIHIDGSSPLVFIPAVSFVMVLVASVHGNLKLHHELSKLKRELNK